MSWGYVMAMYVMEICHEGMSWWHNINVMVICHPEIWYMSWWCVMGSVMRICHGDMSCKHRSFQHDRHDIHAWHIAMTHLHDTMCLPAWHIRHRFQSHEILTWHTAMTYDMSWWYVMTVLAYVMAPYVMTTPHICHGGQKFCDVTLTLTPYYYHTNAY